jgi:hypothetical protein
METWTWRHRHGDMDMGTWTWTWKHRHEHGDVDMYIETWTWRHEKKIIKWKTESEAISHNLYTVCSLYNRMFVVYPFVGEEANGS